MLRHKPDVWINVIMSSWETGNTWICGHDSGAIIWTSGVEKPDPNIYLLTMCIKWQWVVLRGFLVEYRPVDLSLTADFSLVWLLLLSLMFVRSRTQRRRWKSRMFAVGASLCARLCPLRRRWTPVASPATSPMETMTSTLSVQVNKEQSHQQNFHACVGYRKSQIWLCKYYNVALLHRTQGSRKLASMRLCNKGIHL